MWRDPPYVPNEAPGSHGKAPAVSVLMDVTDGTFVGAALASLAEQTFADFEIVLCANAASEQTCAIIAAWQAKDARLRVVWSERLPLARAHNLVAAHARAPLLARLDADDVALPHRLERQVALLLERPELGFVGSAVRAIDREDRPLCNIPKPAQHDEIVRSLRLSCPIVHSTLVVRAGVFWEAGGYRPGLNLAEDWDLCARLVEHCRGANIDEPLVEYRLHNGSLTNRRTERMVISGIAASATRDAKLAGEAEPFVRGVPSLRRAQHTLGLSRQRLRSKVRAAVWQARFSRVLLAGRLPLRLNGWVRALAIAAGMRPIYAGLIRALAAFPRPVGSRAR